MDEMTEKEREQLQRFETLRRLACAVLLRRLWAPLLVGVLAFAALCGVLYRRALAADRFEARAVFLFHPRATEHIKALEAKEVFQILFRRTLKDGLAERLMGEGASDAFRRRLYRTVEFRPEGSDPNIFNALVRAPTAQAAIERANAFAEVCLKAYAAYREADLGRWTETTEARRRELLARLDALAKEEEALDRGARVARPRQELARLDEALDRQKTALAEARVRLAKETAQLRRLEADWAEIPAAVVAHAGALRRRLAARDALDAEIAAAEGVYTERNPRLLVLRERRAALLAQDAAFCASNGVEGVARATIEKVDARAEALKQATARAEAARETCAALEAEIAGNARAVARLQEVLPGYARIDRRRELLQRALAEVEDIVSDIRYLRASVKDDLALVEPVASAEETAPLTRKKQMLAFMGACVAAGFAAVLLVLLDLLLGRVRDAAELALHPELNVLGSLPPETAPFASREEEKRILDGFSYRFTSAMASARTIVVGRLPGASYSRRLHDSFDWNCAMAGRRLLRVEIVSARGFAAPDGAETLGGLALKGASAFFPVQDDTRLSPGEVELLKSDVKALGARFDLFVFGRRRPLARHSIYFEQMAKLCDCALLFVGAGATPRAALRAPLALRRRVGKPFFAVVSDERSWSKVRGTGEYE